MQPYIFNKNDEPASLSIKEISIVESLITKQISEYNKAEADIYKKNVKETKKKFPNSTPYDFSIKNPLKYYRQYIAVTNNKGEKEVWVNCFCSIKNMPYWRNRIVGVMDGGNCYFNLKVNLTKNTAHELIINGVA